MRNKLEVKLDLVNVYELESDESFDYDKLPPEEQKAIDDSNEKYEHNELQKSLMEKALPCQCMSRELQERAMRRASILSQGPGPMPIQLQLTQDDLNQKDFVVIINTDKGIYKDVRCIVSHCRRCGEMHLWGDLEPIGTLLAHAFMDHDTTEYRKDKRANEMKKLIDEGPKPPEGTPQFILENTETGEITPADDLVRGLAGLDPMPDGMYTEPVEEPKPDPVPNEPQSTGHVITAVDSTPSGEKPSLILPD